RRIGKVRVFQGEAAYRTHRARSRRSNPRAARWCDATDPRPHAECARLRRRPPGQFHRRGAGQSLARANAGRMRRLVSGYRCIFLEQKSELVDTVEQTMSAEWIDRKLVGAAVGQIDGLRAEIDRDLSTR